MAHFMVVSNNQYPWKDILSGCFIQIVEAGTAIEAVNKVKQGIDYIRAYAVGQVHPHFNSCDGAGIGITPFAPVPDFPDFEFEVMDKEKGVHIRNYDYILRVHKLYADYTKLTTKRLFVVGLGVGGLMECPETSIDSPIEVIEATTRYEALDIYNAKYKCYFFFGHVAAEIDDNFKPYNFHRDAKMGDVLDAMEKYRKTHQVVPVPTSEMFDLMCQGSSEMKPNQTVIDGVPIDAVYKTVAEDLLKKMKANEDGLVGVKCKVELDDGRVVNIFASEDDDVVCVRRSDIQKAINDLDEAAK